VAASRRQGPASRELGHDRIAFDKDKTIMVRKNNTIQRAALMKEALQNNNATGVDFAGMNYAQFVSGVAPSFDQREEYEGNLMLAVGQRQEIENADENSATYVTHMRDAIRCHPDYGPNSALYVQCGYIADNQKKSGLTRGQGEADETNGTNDTNGEIPPPTGEAE
jgi:hypothetical protein